MTQCVCIIMYRGQVRGERRVGGERGEGAKWGEVKWGGRGGETWQLQGEGQRKLPDTIKIK